LIVAGAVLGALVALPGVTSSGASTRTPVMGRSALNARQLAVWYRRHHGGAQPHIPALHNDVRALAQIFINVGRREGVRGDIAFVQAMLETGWLSFGGSQVPPDAYNYAGIYAFNGRRHLRSCQRGDGHPSRCMGSPEHGVLMQMQLLRSYADPNTRHMHGRLITAPADRIGAAPLWEDFGGQTCPCHKLIWASANDYGTRIVARYRQALADNGLRTPTTPTRPTLHVGDHGTAVQELQHDFNTLTDAHLTVDGAFGPRTQQAVENLQRFFHLQVDGIVGPHTWSLLDYLLAAKHASA
jgi:hypothetical protein